MQVSVGAVGLLALALVPALTSYVGNVDLAHSAQSAAHALNAAGSDTTPGIANDPIEPALPDPRRDGQALVVEELVQRAQRHVMSRGDEGR